MAGAEMSDAVAPDLLRSFVDRIERLNAERDELGEDVKAVYAEARGQGFDVKILRKVIALRKKDPAQRIEEAEIIDLYLAALGMLAGTPLGDAAVERQFGAHA